MPTPSFASIDAHLTAQPELQRGVLERVRAIVRKAVPDVTEAIAYQMPAFKLGDTTVLFIAGWKKHGSIYPATAGVRAAFATELAPYDVNDKGTMRFPLDDVPEKLIASIASIAKLRAQEVREASR